MGRSKEYKRVKDVDKDFDDSDLDQLSEEPEVEEKKEDIAQESQKQIIEEAQTVEEETRTEPEKERWEDEIKEVEIDVKKDSHSTVKGARRKERLGLYMLMVGVSAISLAGMAAFFSVLGLSKLFAASKLPVILMMTAIEAGKVTAVAFVDRFWHSISGRMKVYLVPAIVGAMIVTSASIYGFLSSSYQETADKLGRQESLRAVEQTKKETYEQQVQQLQKQIDLKSARIEELIAVRSKQETRLDSLYNKGWYNSARRTEGVIESANDQANKLEVEISDLMNRQSELRTKISETEIKMLELDDTDVAAELGPLRFTANLLGWDMDTVASIFILLIILLFDPMALVLVMAWNHLVKYGKESREDGRKR